MTIAGWGRYGLGVDHCLVLGVVSTVNSCSKPAVCAAGNALERFFGPPGFSFAVEFGERVARGGHRDDGGFCQGCVDLGIVAGLESPFGGGTPLLPVLRREFDMLGLMMSSKFVEQSPEAGRSEREMITYPPSDKGLLQTF